MGTMESAEEREKKKVKNLLIQHLASNEREIEGADRGDRWTISYVLAGIHPV